MSAANGALDHVKSLLAPTPPNDWVSAAVISKGEYGVPAGLRTKLQGIKSYFDPASGKITGLDYNLWVEFTMTKDEVVATLKYTLDQRLKGNRAPMIFGRERRFTDRDRDLAW